MKMDFIMRAVLILIIGLVLFGVSSCRAFEKSRRGGRCIRVPMKQPSILFAVLLVDQQYQRGQYGGADPGESRLLQVAARRVRHGARYLCHQRRSDRQGGPIRVVDADAFRRQFPNGLDPIYTKAKSMGTRMGTWGGPDGFGDTPEEEQARIDMMLSSAGNTNGSCLSSMPSSAVAYGKAGCVCSVDDRVPQVFTRSHLAQSPA